MFTKVRKSEFVRSVLAFILITGKFGFMPVHSVQAATLTVVNTNDSGVGSLRQALTDAVAGDTVTFDSALSGRTIHLASTLTLAQDITIDGSALVSKITISGHSDDNSTGDVQVLDVNTSITATLDSLIITKGSFGSGGIWNSGNTLTINNSMISDQ